MNKYTDFYMHNKNENLVFVFYILSNSTKLLLYFLHLKIRNMAISEHLRSFGVIILNVMQLLSTTNGNSVFAL